jgi:integrase
MAKHRGHNEGSIYQRKEDGLWCASVTVGRDPTGRVKRRMIYGKTRKEVQDALVKLLADAQKGIPLDPTRQTVGDYLTRWLEDSVRGTVRPATHENYGYALKHILPTIGSVPLVKLTPQHLQKLYREKQDAGLTRMVLLIHAVMHKALSQAEKWNLVPRNVAALVDPPKIVSKEFHALSPEEAGRLLAAAVDDRLHALYALAISCGLRQGELLGLKWEDVDADKGTLTVRRQLQWVKTKDGDNERQQPIFTEPKSVKGRRTIYLPATAVSALRRHRVRQAEEKLRLGEAWHEHGLVFTTTVGTPMNAASLRNRSFHALLDRAELPRVRFHDLRHTCATLLLGQGVHPKLVQEQLGHSQIAVTLDTYSHVTAPMMKDAASKMDAILSPKPRLP